MAAHWQAVALAHHGSRAAGHDKQQLPLRSCVLQHKELEWETSDYQVIPPTFFRIGREEGDASLKSFQPTMSPS